MNAVDAAGEGLLRHLNPRRGAPGRYEVDCPECHAANAATYQVGEGLIWCRRPECGAKAPVAAVISQARGLTAKEAGALLGDADGPGEVSHQSFITKALRLALAESGSSRLRMVGLEAGEAKGLPIGFYPGHGELLGLLSRVGCPAGDVRFASACLPLPQSPDDRALKGCLVGLWSQPEGGAKLWGVAPRIGPRAFHYEVGLKFDRPYLIDTAVVGDLVVAMQHPLDALCLYGCRVPACALGASSVSPVQAEMLALHGVRRLLLVVDPDSADRTTVHATSASCAPMGISVTFTRLPGSNPVGSRERRDRVLSAVQRGARALS